MLSRSRHRHGYSRPMMGLDETWCAVLVAVTLSCGGSSNRAPAESAVPVDAEEPEMLTCQQAIEAIARDIEALKPEFTQLTDFTVA